MKSKYTVPAAILFAGIIIALALHASLSKQPADTHTLTLLRPVGVSDHILGNPTAKVMIITYTDFDCEYCKGFNETLHQIIAHAGRNGDVAWVFREFPLSELHPNAFAHARAAECAAQVAGNDAFWRFAHALFVHQPVQPSEYGTLAASVGISDNAFATCYAKKDPILDARITADRENALALGAQGAPYSVIVVNGQPSVVLDSAYSYDAVKQLVDQALAGE